MVTPGYVRTMAAYNSEMNRRLYAAAANVEDAERRAVRGAFWGSIHGTLCHLVWGDRMWMSRFDDWERPQVAQRDSAGLIDGFEELRAVRVESDARMEAWAAGVDAAWLDSDLVWWSGDARAERRGNRGFLVAHMFNHQTHHRGQAHTLLMQMGHDLGVTDMPGVVELRV